MFRCLERNIARDITRNPLYDCETVDGGGELVDITLTSGTITVDARTVPENGSHRVNYRPILATMFSGLRKWSQLSLDSVTAKLQSVSNNVWSDFGVSDTVGEVTGAELTLDSASLLSTGILIAALSEDSIPADVDDTFRIEATFTEGTATVTVNLPINLENVASMTEYTGNVLRDAAGNVLRDAAGNVLSVAA